jgi:hypothetical protein
VNIVQLPEKIKVAVSEPGGSEAERAVREGEFVY